MGWNSWDSFGCGVTESKFLENATYFAQHLKPHGWNYVVVDIQWYEPQSLSYDYPKVPQPRMDGFGRYWPTVEKHPSAAGEAGFKPLADKIHTLGLKFGVHLMRGIPRLAVERNLPIEGSAHRAGEVADKTSTCPWNPDNYGVDMSKPGAQDYYDSVFRLLASWGVDLVKVDDLSRPYHQAEIEGIRRAIDRSGRAMVLSTSPGETPVANGAHVSTHANYWRVSDDLWDRWNDVWEQFSRFEHWTPYRGNGAWPDGDMLPLGAIRTMDKAPGARWTRLSVDEQRTLLTLWCIAKSPLMMGGYLPDNDDATLRLLTNDEALAVDQHGEKPRQLRREDGLVVWTSDVPGSRDKYVALFNASDRWAPESAVWASPRLNAETAPLSLDIATAGAKRLYLVTNDAEDGNQGDSAVWGNLVAKTADGERRLETRWLSNTSDTARAARLKSDQLAQALAGAPLKDGFRIGANSVVEYELPEGTQSVQALAGPDAQAQGKRGALRLFVYTGIPKATRDVTVNFAELGLPATCRVRDLWEGKELGEARDSYTAKLRSRASVLLRLSPKD